MLRAVYAPQIRRPACWARLLLLVLLAHLSFMASPLHLTAMEPDREIASAVRMGAALEPSTATGPSVLDAHHHEHCTIEWTVPPHALMTQLLAGSSPGGPRLLADGCLSSDLVHRTVDPPRLADPQALLQVFRI